MRHFRTQQRKDEPSELEAIVTMEITTINSIGKEDAFEIEQDMRIFFRANKPGKLSIKDYVELIVAQYPLLGMPVIEEENRKAVETIALKAIKISLEYSKVNDWASLAVFLSIVQYAKGWERDGNSGFWAYICEQFGYRYSQLIYEILTTSVKTACRKYNRFFMVEPNGDNSYYATVLAHSLSPTKSFYALCDFLMKFYKNNLDCSVYDEDPAIGRMVSVLRERCQGATIEHDEDIRGNVGGIQVGLRALIITRPGYMKRFLAKILQKIGVLLSGGELPGKSHVDILLTQWFIGQLTVPAIRRSSPTHKRTTEIAFSYGKIRVEYILREDGEPALRIPSIRLASRENPVLTIRSRGQLVNQYTIGIYGNDYTATSEEVSIPLSDMADADFIGLEAEIVIGGKQIYTSGISLNAKALLFKDKKLQTGRNLDGGNYTLFSPQSVNIEFQGNVERHRRPYFGQLFDIYIQGEISVFADGKLLFSSRPKEGSLRFILPQTQVEYLIRDTSYPLFSRDEVSITAIGEFDGKNILATTQTGEKLNIQSMESNLYQFSLPNENGVYGVTLTDEKTGRVYDEVRFYIVSSYSVAFDNDYYLDFAEDGNVTLDIDGQHFELSLMGFASKVIVPCSQGDIQIQIPRIRLLLDGNPLPTDAIWKDDISPSSILRVHCPETVATSIHFANAPMTRRITMGGFDYFIGNAVQAYDGASKKVSVNLLIAGDNIHMFDVVFRMLLTESPTFNLTENTLSWLNNFSFMGEKFTKFKIEFKPKHGDPIVIMSGQGVRVLSEDFPSKSERYHYQFFTQTETAFGIVETKIAEGTVIFGDRASAIFRGEIISITKVIEAGNYTEIKPVYAEDITYIGTENLGYTDLNGDYAHYTAKLFFLTKNGKRYFTELNPVDIYLVNEKSGILHISFREGDGLFIDKRGEFGIELYKNIDPPLKLEKYFNIPDFFVYQYSKEIY